MLVLQDKTDYSGPSLRAESGGVRPDASGNRERQNAFNKDGRYTATVSFWAKRDKPLS